MAESCLERLQSCYEFQERYEEQVDEAVSFLARKIGRPKFGIVLGSSLGEVVEVDDEISIPYSAIPNFPVCGVDGHFGKVSYGVLGGVEVLAFRGRKHFYEVADEPFNNGMLKVAFPIHVLAGLGVENYFVTSSAGGLKSTQSEGDLVVLNSHIHLMRKNPLEGREMNFLRVDNKEPCSRFQSMDDAYDSEFSGYFYSIALHHKKTGIHSNGVYLGVTGPSYETSAEADVLRERGDVVGMSTTPEVIVARNRGMRCIGVSYITNLVGNGELNHKRVISTLGKDPDRDKLPLIFEDFFRRAKDVI